MGTPRRRQINLNVPEKRQAHQFIPENAPEKQLVKFQQEINRKKEFLNEWGFLHRQRGKNSQLHKEIKQLEKQRDKLISGLIKR